MKCSRCEFDATIKQGNQNLCDKHYRFGQMRAAAKRNEKAVPDHDQLEKLVNGGMGCPDCGVQMNWRSKDGRATVASLQHYRSGRIGIVCLSCNARHAAMDGDSYCDMPKDHKRCPSCLDTKPAFEFFCGQRQSRNHQEKKYLQTVFKRKKQPMERKEQR